MLDVAKRANVALSTVSYALNGTRPISAETRERILKAVEELGDRKSVV
jgi:DNA-binding LacI/PurR family transcriptional regulator